MKKTLKKIMVLSIAMLVVNFVSSDNSVLRAEGEAVTTNAKIETKSVKKSAVTNEVTSETTENVEKAEVEVEKEPNVVQKFGNYVNNIVESAGIWGPIIFIAAYALGAVGVVFATPLTFLGGALFGPVLGVLYVWLGATIGLSLSFLLARYSLRNLILSKFGESEAFKKIDKGVNEEGWFILATTRFIPIFPFGVQNYVYGLTNIKFSTYAVFSSLFVLPGTIVYVVLSSALNNPKEAPKYVIMASIGFFLLTLITRQVKKAAEKRGIETK